MRTRAVLLACTGVIAACALPLRDPPRPPAAAASTAIGAAPGSTPAVVETCVAPQITEAFTCPTTAPRVATAANVAWPSADHLFHHPPRRRWQSPVVPEALREEVARLATAAHDPASRQLLAAELAFEQAVLGSATIVRGDEKKRPPLDRVWKPAREGYAAFVKSAGPQHPLLAYGLARHARVLSNVGQFDPAFDEVLAELLTLRALPTSVGADFLGPLARRELGALHARSKRAPGELLGLLQSSTFDAATTNELMEEVAAGYLDAGRYDEARSVLGELASRHGGAKRCTYGARRIAISIVENPAAYKALWDLARDQVTLQKQVAPEPSARAEEQECREATVALLAELAIAWHVEAVGWGGIKGTNDARTRKLASLLYELLDEHLTSNELGDASLPWVPAANRPTRARVRFARADLALFQKDWEECGVLFESAYAAAPDDAMRAAATLRSASCYSNWVVERSKGPNAIPLEAPENKLLEWGGRYLCTVAPETEDAEAYDRRLDIELTRGAAFYRAHDWARAVASLERLAFEPGRPQARQAAALYLVALHRERESSGKPECRDQFERDQLRLISLHCSGADDDALSGPSVEGLTVSKRRTISPCEAIRAVGAPLAPLPAPPPVARPPSIRFDQTSVSGNAVPEHITWVARLHAGQWQACYEAALGKNPFLEGEQFLSFAIGTDGGVREASSSSQLHGDADLDACFRRTALGMRFGQPEGGVVNVYWTLPLSRTRGAVLAHPPHVSQHL